MQTNRGNPKPYMNEARIVMHRLINQDINGQRYTWYIQVTAKANVTTVFLPEGQGRISIQMSSSRITLPGPYSRPSSGSIDAYHQIQVTEFKYWRQ